MNHGASGMLVFGLSLGLKAKIFVISALTLALTLEHKFVCYF